MLTQEAPAVEDLAKRLAEIAPQVVFLDFTLSEDEPGKLFRSAELARLLARIAPGIPRVAVGLLSQPEGAIAALRAGVSDFVDPSVAPQEVKDVVQRLLDTPVAGGGAPTASGAACCCWAPVRAWAQARWPCTWPAWCRTA